MTKEIIISKSVLGIIDRFNVNVTFKDEFGLNVILYEDRLIASEGIDTVKSVLIATTWINEEILKGERLSMVMFLHIRLEFLVMLKSNIAGVTMIGVVIA